ncbi:MAG: DUF4132 domain-containing protein [Polyangiales bacterium]
MADETEPKKKKEDTIEVAKSGRAKCRGCGDKIEKGALRFGLVDFAFSESGSHRWFHLVCAQAKAGERLRALLGQDLESLAPHRDAINAELGAPESTAANVSKASTTDLARPVLSKSAWPLWLTKAKAPTRKIPHWVRSTTQPSTLGGEVLDAEACILLVGAMMKDKADRPDKVLAEFRGWLEPASYRRFAWELFRGWAHADAHMVQRWVVRHVANVVDDDLAGPLGEMIEVLVEKKKRDAVYEAATALCAHGSPTALQVVQRLAQRYKYRGNNNPCLAALKAEAAKRRMTLADLEDASVPTCGLDARGKRRFSYGPRTFTLQVDGEMRISVVADDDGTRLPRLPKAWKGDDADKVQEAQAEFARLKRDIEAMLPVQARRLEGALSSGREWTLSAWTKSIRRHPLMQIIARRLIWVLCRGEDRVKSFRVDELDELTDASDEPCELTITDGNVRLAHPAEMSADERAAWDVLFKDYEIMPPFPQLARPSFVLGEEERESTMLGSFSHEPTKIGPLHGRFNRADWSKGFVDDYARIRTFHKEFAGGFRATAHLDPGFHPAGYDDLPQRITHVDFRPSSGRTILAIKDVPTAVISEVLYNMNTVAG